MGEKLVSLCSGPLTADPGTRVEVSDFLVETAHEGPQILVTWAIPDIFEASEIRLVRKRFMFSERIDDGKLLLTEAGPPFTETNYSDIDVFNGEVFYYTMFHKRVDTGLWVTSSRTQGKAFALATGFFHQRLVDHLPRIYRTQDDLQTQKELLESVIDNRGERINFLEQQEDPFGPLYRFLKNFGLSLDRVKGILDAYPGTILDVDRTCSDFLPFMGRLVGIDPNFEIPIQKQRSEIKNAIPTWKTKGTVPGVVGYAENVTQLDATPHEFSNNVLIMHKKGRKIAFLTDFTTQNESNKPGDTTSRIISVRNDDKYSHVKYALYFTLEPDIPLRREVVAKLVRLQPVFEPQSSIGFFIFLDVAYEDIYDVSDVLESSEDVITTLDEESYDSTNVNEDFDDTITTDISVFLHSVEFPPSAGGIDGLSNGLKISEYIPTP